MKVVDSYTGNLENKGKCMLVVVDILKDGHIIYGYVADRASVIQLTLIDRDRDFHSLRTVNACYELVKDKIFYSNLQGVYFSKYLDFTPEGYLRERFSYGNGRYPYQRFVRKYEAIESFDIFKDKQKLLKIDFYELSKYLKYTFGLEFETSGGYIPEHLCFRDGLIPLRDGSINGLEYSTVVLSGNEGINLLRQQVETLNEYTIFNKECSLHIHLGGFPMVPDVVYNLYRVCKKLECELSTILPPLAFRSSEYKATGKDYCKKLPSIDSLPNFNMLYAYLVGKNYMGSFTQPHPRDITREAKWRIPTRYYWMNLVNLLCYRINKTVEFRFLSPTFNFNKIVTWLGIMNAILLFAEKTAPLSMRVLDAEMSGGLATIVKSVYPKDFAEVVLLGLKKLSLLTYIQSKNGDNIGSNIQLENKLFS